MKKLSTDLKRMLTGLAHQDASEFSSFRDKIQVLGYGSETRERQPTPPPQVARRPRSRRIALISDGRGRGAPLSYVIEAGLRQDAQIDLLVHGAADTESISALENQIREAGLDGRCIRLDENAAAHIAGYLRNHPSLIFLVAMPDDSAARVLIEEVRPQRGNRIPVPLVLIEEHAASRPRRQSAA